jgi:hypothetical protein
MVQPCGQMTTTNENSPYLSNRYRRFNAEGPCACAQSARHLHTNRHQRSDISLADFESFDQLIRRAQSPWQRLACSLLLMCPNVETKWSEESCLQPFPQNDRMTVQRIIHIGDNPFRTHQIFMKGGICAGSSLHGENRKYLTIRENGAESPQGLYETAGLPNCLPETALHIPWSGQGAGEASPQEDRLTRTKHDQGDDFEQNINDNS